MNYTLEVCANGVQSAVNAQQGGAHRVELCSNLWEGGTTPSYATLKLARHLLDIDIFVLIRPRGGNFAYTDLEFELMKEDILMCKSLGIDGIVSGVLNNDGTIDSKRTQELVELSRPLPFTFHRAFDLTPNLHEAMVTLCGLNVDRVLTSGGQSSAPAASEVLEDLRKQAGDKLTILPGGGIKLHTIDKLIDTGFQEFHMSGSHLVKTLQSTTELALNGVVGIPESDYYETSTELIKSVVDKLQAKK